MHQILTQSLKTNLTFIPNITPFAATCNINKGGMALNMKKSAASNFMFTNKVKHTICIMAITRDSNKEIVSFYVQKVLRTLNGLKQILASR